MSPGGTALLPFRHGGLLRPLRVSLSPPLPRGVSFIPRPRRLRQPRPLQRRLPARRSAPAPSPSPSASSAARVGFSCLSSEPDRASRRSRWWIRAGSPPSAFAARRCRHVLRLLLPPVAFTFPSAYAAPASTVPVAGTRAASDFSACSSCEPRIIPGTGRGGEPVPGPRLRPVPLPVGAAVARAVPARPPDRPSAHPSVRVPCSFAGRFAGPAHAPLGLLRFARTLSRIVRGVLLPFLSFLRPAAFSLTPDASLMPSTANARLTGTSVPFDRQMTTGCCRKHLSPIGGTGVCRGHTENPIEIQRVPRLRDWPGPGVVVPWPSAQYGAMLGDVRLVSAQSVTPC